MLLLIDNYDSFTYNLAQHLGALGAAITVARNDEISVAEILALAPSHLILSPGPGTPDESGVCLAALRELPLRRPALPILGVCLGHQAIGQVYGARVVRAAAPIHGKVWPILHGPGPAGAGRPTAADPLLAGLPSPFPATRYHSLVLDPASLPAALLATAWTAEGALMALRHRRRPIHGVQFHPESIGTPHGLQLLRNFLALAPLSRAAPGPPQEPAGRRDPAAPRAPAGRGRPAAGAHG